MRAVVFSGLILLFIAGCASLSSGGGSGGRVDEGDLFGLPGALNMDNKPGADGFAWRVLLTKTGSAKGSPVRDGAIEVLMFDGVVSVEKLVGESPAQTWHFTARELARYEEQSSLGRGYRFALQWREAPTHGHLTVLARYAPVKGEPVYSAPSTISAASR